MYKIYITYMKGHMGPYMVVFDTQKEAESWMRNTTDDMRITKIDML